MSHILNPFYPEFGVVIDEGFIGRRNGLERIVRSVIRPSPSNLAIVGMRRIGKSSLVSQGIMQRRAELNAMRVIPIWIAFASYDTPADFFRNLATECCAEIDSLGWLTDSIGKSYQKVDKDSNSEVLYDYTRDFFKQVRRENIRPLFVIDEFDHATHLFRDDASNFQKLRDLLNNVNYRTSFVTTSRRTVREIELTLTDTSSLAGLFETYYLSLFDNTDIAEYFARFETANVYLTEEERQRIIYYCGGHPLLLVHLGHEIVEAHHHQKIINIDHAAQQKENLFSDQYDSIIDRLRQDGHIDELLKLVVPQQPQEPSAKIYPSRQDAVQIIERLTRLGLLQSSDPPQLFSAHFQAYLLKASELIDVKRTLRHALSLMKQGDLDEAERLLNSILDMVNNTQAVNLLATIRRARITGQMALLDDMVSEAALSDFVQPISGFAQFFLDRCEFKGVPTQVVRTGTFTRTDVADLEDLAAKLGINRPRERADYYLSAAKIESILEKGKPLPSFYKYLGRAFTSLGDAAVGAGGPLDCSRDLYCEALVVYDNARDRLGVEQDHRSTLVRFLYATLEATSIPLKPNGPTIEEALEDVLTRHPSHQQVFDAIAYLIYRSKSAASYILEQIYRNTTWQYIAVQYLRERIQVTTNNRDLDDFVRLWDEWRRNQLEDAREVSSDLHFLGRMNWTTAIIEDSVERLRQLGEHPFFGLDQQRLAELRRILEQVLDLFKQATFEEQERLCFQIDRRCQDALREIGDNPTKVSIEEFRPVLIVIQQKVQEWLEELYQRSAPDLTLRLAIESYTPDSDGQIEVQAVVENRLGRSPAEALELVVLGDAKLFMLSRANLKLEESLRGGDQRIIRVPLQVLEPAITANAFSMRVYTQYRTRANEVRSTHIQSLAIRLHSEAEFVPIENPYAAHAEGGPVEDPTMFYGRSELIANVEQVLRENGSRSKSIIIYGQKRSGKSSVLYHLKRRLEATPQMLVVDVGNIGAFLDDRSAIPFEYQILSDILRHLQDAVEDRVDLSSSISAPVEFLTIDWPRYDEFFSFPSPLQLFNSVLNQFRRAAARNTTWRGIRIVLLIDEFSYIYGQILRGRIAESFMKNWKALLEANFFSIVLAGQDVMPRFKQRFPNEFGIIQDERVSYLAPEDALRLIDEPIRVGGHGGESRYREQAIERILELTAGSPFYIQILCNRLVQYMNRKRIALVTRADVEQVKDELIWGVNALSADKFENLVNSGDTSPDAIEDDDILAVLQEIALRSDTGPCSRGDIICKTTTPIDIILNDLVNRDVLERERSQYYQIRVGLFKEWLVAHR